MGRRSKIHSAAGQPLFYAKGPLHEMTKGNLALSVRDLGFNEGEDGPTFLGATGNLLDQQGGVNVVFNIPWPASIMNLYDALRTFVNVDFLSLSPCNCALHSGEGRGRSAAPNSGAGPTRARRSVKHP